MKKLLSLVLALTLCLGMAVPVCAANRTIYLASNAWLPEYPEYGVGGIGGYKAVEVSPDLGSIALYGDLEPTGGTVSVPLEYEDGTYDFPVYRSNGPVTVTLTSGLEEGVISPDIFEDGEVIGSYLPTCVGINTMSYDKDAKFYNTLKEDALYFDGKVLLLGSEEDESPEVVSIRELKEKGLESEYGDYYYAGATAVLSEPGIYEVYFYVPVFGYSTVSAMIYVENASSGGEQAGSFTAMPTNDQLTVNGKLQSPTVYKIGGSNYFKIRDLAAMLSGSEKQFDVGYDGALASVTLTTGKGYAKQAGDMAGAATGGNQTAAPSNDTIYINGQKIDVTVYKIGGSNYFKLRDLGKALDFYVGWTAKDGVFIDTSKPYSD